MPDEQSEKVYRKTVTEAAEDVLVKGLQGENIDAMLASLSPYGKTIWEDMLTQFRASGDSELLDQLNVADYIEKPPTMNQFLEDGYYLGTLMVKSQDSEGMFPAWKEILCKDFNYDSAIHNCVVTGSLGIGKCMGFNDLCLMHDGSTKPVQDILVGDKLMGDDSSPRTVLSLARGRGEMFEIASNDFDSFKVNADHILCLKFVGCAGITEISVRDFLHLPAEKRNDARLYRVAVEWPEKPVTVDPYWLGLWLGDGHSHCTSITTSDPEIADYHQKYAESLGLTVNVSTDKRGNAAKLYTATNPDRSARRTDGNALANRLRAYGLCFGFRRKTEKQIPEAYLVNSSQVRRQLLAGLIDTDGSKSKAGKAGVFDITVKQKPLAKQIRWLALSLGYGASTPKLKIVNSTAYWRVIIGGADDLPVRVAHKKSEARQGKDYYQTARFAVIPIGVGDYYGFTLDGNGRYLLHDFVVTHNTFIMVTIILYRVLIATLLRNPHNFFGLTKGTKIIFNLLSVTKAAVTETAFGDAMNFMANCPYFLEECNYNPDNTYTNFRIPLKNSLMLTAGSKGQHLLGRNIIGVGLDEGNWRLEADPDTKAYELFNEVRNRINNRFRKVAGFLPAISILASSAKDESSFTEVIIREIENAHDPSCQKVYRNSVYKIKRHALQLGPRWFKVAYGLKNIPPMILSGWYDEHSNSTGAETHEAPAPGASTELVPEMYYQEFKRRPLNALRDVCGISTGGVNRWFASMVDFEKCFSGDTRIITYEGTVPIKSLAGSTVTLLSQPVGSSGYCHPKWVQAEVKSFGHQRLWKLTLRRNKVEKIVYTTDSHRWFVWNSLKYRPKLTEKETKDLVIGNAIPAIYGQRLLFASESPKGTSLSPIGVIHGIVFGDGYLGSKEGSDSIQPSRVILFGKKDAELLDWFPRKARTKPVTINTKLGSADGLKVNDLPRYFKSFPPLNESPSYLIGWLAGYFAADGNVTTLGEARLASACLKNLEFAEMICQRLGIRTTGIAVAYRKGCCTTEKALYTLHFHVGALPDDFFLINDHRSRNKPRTKEAQCWAVKNLEPTDRVEEVFCAVVPETGTFALEGNILTGNCVELAERDGVVCPTTSGLEMLPTSMEDKQNIWDYLDHKTFLTRVQSQITPKRHPYSLRYAHIDLATQNMAGIAICHLVGRALVENLVQSGVPFSEYRLIVEYDFILTITAGQVKPISLEKIQNFIIWLSTKCGYNFGLVTFDQFQSEQSLQMLEARGFKAERQSLDRNKDAYLNWRMAVEELRLRPYRHRHMMLEAENLLDTEKKVDHPPNGCVTAETKIRLLDGTCPMIAELVEKPGEIWVYASDGRGCIVPARAHAARLTKHVNELLEITLDNNRSVRCTPEHLFMMRDGSYRKASDLKRGDSLMPFHRKMYRIRYKRGSAHYEQVWSNGNWRLTHRLVSQHLGFEAGKNEVIHHKDLNPLNNTPGNLEKLTRSEHNRRHILISKVTSDPNVVKRRVKTFKQRYAASPERQAKRSETAKRVWSTLSDQAITKFRANSHTFSSAEAHERNIARWSSPEYRKAQTSVLSSYAKSDKGRAKSSETASKTNRDSRGNWSPDRLQKHTKNVYNAMLLRRLREDERALALVAPWRDYLLGPCHAMRLTGSGAPGTWKRRLAGADWAANAEKLRGKSQQEMTQLTGLNEKSLRRFLACLDKYDIISMSNHKVVSVRSEKCVNEPVYDLTVDGYENFCIDAGISIHNSKDTTDAAAGAYNNAINSDEKVTMMSPNNPRLHGTRNLEGLIQEKPLIDIPLPQGYTRLKKFTV